MTIQFNLEYHTQWGQSVWIIGSLPQLGENQPEQALPLEYLTNGIWQLEATIPEDAAFTYRYLIRENGKDDNQEYGRIHSLENIKTPRLIIFDHWQNFPVDQPFYSSAFTKCVFKHENATAEPALKTDTLVIRCYAPECSAHQLLLLSGNNTISGNWDPQKAPAMYRIRPDEWEITFDRKEIQLPFHFKFISTEESNRQNIVWEEGSDHIIPDCLQNETGTLLADGFHFRRPKLNWKGAGVAIPVFSLRSEKGYGIGEFSDLIPLIDWAVQTGQKIIQILPVNDTTMTHTWHDSYPYNANSIFALHPAYIRLEEAGILQDKEKMDDYRKELKRLNKLSDIDYEKVTEGKWAYLRKLFEEKGTETLASDSFKRFFENNKEWLLPYSAFSYLRDKHKTPYFHWWSTCSTYDAAEVERMNHPESEEYTELAFYQFVQYLLDRQLSKVSAYAREKGIILKGDIPIGISRTSADAWVNPALFHMDSQAGAPPDDFSKNGQNWGFPTYNWELMKEDHYDWWKKRFTKMADYFDAYRIDHILGFFRIWEIPFKATQGLLGHFNPALPFTADEIRAFGFNFEEDRVCNPYIREYFLQELFGENTQEVKESFLESTGWESYALKKEYDTQREIESNFNDLTDEKTLHIRDGLLRLVGEVLFLEDRKQKGKYHPRIAAQETKAYEALDPSQKNAYNRLYNQFFYERNNKYWCHEALEKLPPLLNATPMLACAEDLGMIPAGVAEVLEELRILSLEIQRMPKKQGLSFDDPKEYPYLSVCTTSTHDMSTLREWWEENRQLSQRYYHEQLHGEGQAPDTCTGTICESIINQHLQSPAMFTILPIQDWLSMDENLRRDNPHEERINVPAISRHYWRYRMHLSIDELMQADAFNQKMKDLIIKSGR
ncbi:MAG: 4-alpha-glucanotransferase [Bacteroidales bacterium]